MSHNITASWEMLLSQSPEIADKFLRAAIAATKDLPAGVDRTAVIVAHMRASSDSWSAASLGVSAQRISYALADIREALGAGL